LLFKLFIGKKCSPSALLILDADAPLFGGRRIGLPARLLVCSRLVLPLKLRLGDTMSFEVLSNNITPTSFLLHSLKK
jgi:hypothetical protein